MTTSRGMSHITLRCRNHPDKLWHCKSIAVNRNGSYNGQRNLFTHEMLMDECECPASDLEFATEQDRETWIADALAWGWIKD